MAKIIILQDTFNQVTGEPIKKGAKLDLGDERNQAAVDNGLAEWTSKPAEDKSLKRDLETK